MDSYKKLARDVITLALDDICPLDGLPDDFNFDHEKVLDRTAEEMVQQYRDRFQRLQARHAEAITKIAGSDNSREISAEAMASASIYREKLRRWRLKYQRAVNDGERQVLEAEKDSLVAQRQYAQRRILAKLNNETLEEQLAQADKVFAENVRKLRAEYSQQSDFYEARLLRDDTFRSSVNWFADDYWNVRHWCDLLEVPTSRVYEAAARRIALTGRECPEFEATWQQVRSGGKEEEHGRFRFGNPALFR